MTKLLVAVPIIISLSAQVHALDIYRDRGGVAVEYAVRFAKASKPIRVWGTCSSACTLALAYPSTCAGPRGAFSFHAATHPLITRWMFAKYPANIQAWISTHGGLYSRMITLSGRELRARVRNC